MFVDERASYELKSLAEQPIEVILIQLQRLPENYHLALRHNDGSYLNHKLFLAVLRIPTTTAAENKPIGSLLEAIEKKFGLFDKFKKIFTTAIDQSFRF